MISTRGETWLRGQQVVVASAFVGVGGVVAVFACVVNGPGLLLLAPAAVLVGSGVAEIGRVRRARR